MRSLRWRLTLWFAGSLLAVIVVLVVSAHWHLDHELRQEKWERTHPAHPDWILHGRFTDQEVHDILGELLGFWLILGVPMAGLALLAAYLLARQSMKPIRNLNEQLTRLGAHRLSERVAIHHSDRELAELGRHLNDLLARLERSFAQLQDYTGQVAHELRTPLQLMRLRVESEAARLSPELAEELEEELARLSDFVERVLTVARAEQGRLEVHCAAVELKSFLRDVLEPFSRLAAAEDRRLLWSCPDEAVVWSDPSLLKQILFNLLNNALKHGTGDICLRVKTRTQAVSILVWNRPTPDVTIRKGVGIGLRLVRALAQELDQTLFALRRGKYFWVLLRMPLAASNSRARKEAQPAAPHVEQAAGFQSATPV